MAEPRRAAGPRPGPVERGPPLPARARRVVRRLGAAGRRARLPARRPGVAHRIADSRGLPGTHRQAGLGPGLHVSVRHREAAGVPEEGRHGGTVAPPGALVDGAVPGGRAAGAVRAALRPAPGVRGSRRGRAGAAAAARRLSRGVPGRRGRRAGADRPAGGAARPPAAGRPAARDVGPEDAPGAGRASRAARSDRPVPATGGGGRDAAGRPGDGGVRARHGPPLDRRPRDGGAGGPGAGEDALRPHIRLGGVGRVEAGDAEPPRGAERAPRRGLAGGVRPMGARGAGLRGAPGRARALRAAVGGTREPRAPVAGVRGRVSGGSRRTRRTTAPGGSGR